MISNSSLVSVIIPTYNVDKYIYNCLKSIVEQTYKNIEVIVVDDCSLDHTKSIISEFASTDSRIHLISLDNNQGVSNARNTGFNYCRGEYIIFVDSDDIIKSDAIEILVKSFEENIDFVCCGYRTLSECNIDYNSPRQGIFNVDDGLDLLVNDYGFFTSVWNKMFRRSIFEGGYVEFEKDIAIGEDYLWLAKVICKCKKVKNIKDCLYDWNLREGSAVSDINRVNSKKSLSAIYANTEVIKIIHKKLGHMNKAYISANVRLFDLLKNVLQICVKTDDKELKRNIHRIAKYEWRKFKIYNRRGCLVKLKYYILFKLSLSKIGVMLYNNIHKK